MEELADLEEEEEEEGSGPNSNLAQPPRYPNLSLKIALFRVALKIRKFEIPLILGEQSTSESVLSTSLSLDNKLSPRFPEEMQLGRNYHQRCHPPLVLMLKENMWQEPIFFHRS